MEITCQKCGAVILRVEAYIYDRVDLHDVQPVCGSCYQALADQLFALEQRYRQLQEYRKMV